MDAQNTRLSLLNRILACTDDSIIQKIDALLVNVEVKNQVYKVSDAEKEMLLCSEEDIRAGRIISNEQVIAEEQRWLN